MTLETLETFTLDTPALTLSPSDSPELVIIWLHGLGADGHDFEEVIPLLKLPEMMKIRFIFPHAPITSVTVNQGMMMRAWYDLISIEVDREVDQEGIERSSRQLEKLIRSVEATGVPSERIVLAGFSQGGVIAYHTALRHASPLAGLIAISSYLPTLEQIKHEQAEEQAELPIFISHGSIDPVVPFSLGEKARDALTSLGYSVVWHEYPIPHQMCFEQIEEISEFIQQRYYQPRSSK